MTSTAFATIVSAQTYSGISSAIFDFPWPIWFNKLPLKKGKSGRKFGENRKLRRIERSGEGGSDDAEKRLLDEVLLLE